MKSTQAGVNRRALKKLFQEIGSEVRLRLILRDFYRRMAADILIGFFFMGKNTDDVADKQSEFLLKAMGQVPTYLGKSPPRAHSKLPPILAGHFDRRLKLLEDTLREHGLASESIDIWLQFEGSFRGVIVKSEF